ncbi:MAG: hypothetical protein H7256_07485 [Bdellovibrio sp.]|nr:hypothetical protein [Bdellovibrio sp.]
MRHFLQIICFVFAINAYAQDKEMINSSSIDFENYQPKSFGITFFNLAGYSDQQFRQSDPSFTMYDSFISFNYKVNRDFRIGARPAFGYTTSGSNYKGEQVGDRMIARDFSLVAKFLNLFDEQLPAAWDISNQFRLYLPTSDGSKTEGMIARLRSEFQVVYHISRGMEVRYYAKPSYYFQRSTTYAFYYPDNPTNPVPRTTSFMDLEHGGEFSYDLNRYFAIHPAFEFKEEWSNSSPSQNLGQYRTSKLRTGVGLEIAPSRDLNFIVSIQTTQDLLATDRTPETGYVLMTNAALF